MTTVSSVIMHNLWLVGVKHHEQPYTSLPSLRLCVKCLQVDMEVKAESMCLLV
jgi:hypothetical protein